METTSNFVEASKKNTDQVKRLSTYEYAYHLIKSLEGYREKAYWDHKQWSIGFGTKSHPGQVMTKQEIYDAYHANIEPRVWKIHKDYPKLSTCKQAALVSLYYNCPSCYREIMQKGISERRWKSYIYASGKKQGGLVKRRQRERELYVTC